MDINKLRHEIDGIDKQLTELFEKRMKIAAEIVAYKKDNGLPVCDKEREQFILSKVSEISSPETKNYALALYEKIFELSRSYQEDIFPSMNKSVTR